ncbi:hypothetical protein [Nocardia sp. NPDC057455]|uniref:hypothetical protein n=1 Tax=Nocardia sp. NPDC057455 TaxID=3346138 RepID=UPI0036718680
MADEATPQETTTENPSTDAPADADTANVDTPEVGADVQGTETETEKSETSNPEIERLQRELEKVRKEAASNRVKGNEKADQAAKDAAAAAEQALTEKWAKALGLVKDDEPADPAELLKQAEEREKQIAAERDAAAERLRAYERKDAITKAVNAVEGDLESILDSRKVSAEIEKLDTNADDFAAQVAAIVSAAVESNPKLKKAPAQVAAPRSGGDLSGGNAAPKSHGPKTVDDFRREIAERNKRG